MKTVNQRTTCVSKDFELASEDSEPLFPSSITHGVSTSILEMKQKTGVHRIGSLVALRVS